ncbi:MAG: corrinoid protein [Chloroflexota bacterium]|jgi:5-methyltetrahydrofolate--homocysteine methyltransferase
MSDALVQISNAVIEGRVKDIPSLTNTALSSGLTAKDILDKGLMPGMDVIGAEFKKGKKFVPEVLLSARTMQASLDILKPLLAQAGEKMAGKVIIGTVKGDLHDIGKSLVGMMLEGAGFEVVNLGKDVPPEKFVDAVKKEKPDIVAMSALLTTTMRSMGHTVTALKEAGLRESVKIMIGGAPVTVDFAKQIGADAYAANAPAAAELAKKLINSN